MAKLVLSTGIIAAFFAVALGAFGAHALKERVAADMLQVWQTAVTYQFFHALALIGLGLWLKSSGASATLIYAAFTAGIILFSGSLYALVLSGVKGLGAVTPLGGVLFLVGWLLWLMKVLRDGP